MSGCRQDISTAWVQIKLFYFVKWQLQLAEYACSVYVNLNRHADWVSVLAYKAERSTYQSKCIWSTYFDVEKWTLPSNNNVYFKYLCQGYWRKIISLKHA